VNANLGNAVDMPETQVNGPIEVTPHEPTEVTPTEPPVEPFLKRFARDTLTKSEKVEHHIRMKTQKLFVLRFWVKSGVNPLSVG